MLLKIAFTNLRLECFSSSVGNPPFFRDLDLELELLCSMSGIEISNTEWNNVPTGLDLGLGINLLDVVDCGIGI